MYKVIIHDWDRHTATLALLPNREVSIIRSGRKLSDTANGNLIDAVQCWRDGGTLAQVIETLLAIEYGYSWSHISIEDYTIPQGDHDD